MNSADLDDGSFVGGYSSLPVQLLPQLPLVAAVRVYGKLALDRSLGSFGDSRSV